MGRDMVCLYNLIEMAEWLVVARKDGVEDYKGQEWPKITLMHATFAGVSYILSLHVIAI